MRRHPAADPVRLNPYRVPARAGLWERRILMQNPANRKGRESSR